MLLTTLPVEVLELIFLYVDVESLFNAWDAVGMEGCNFFWEKVCKREGFTKAENEKDKSWRSVFQRNMNWKTRRFTLREYHVPKELSDLLSLEYYNNEPEIQEGNLLLKKYDSLFVWNIDEMPKEVHVFNGYRSFKVDGSKLLLFDKKYNDSKDIYSLQNNMYNHIFTAGKHVNGQSYAFSDKFFVSVSIENNMTIIKAVNLTNFEEFSLPVSSKKVQYLSLILSDYFLYVIILDQNQWTLRKNCLTNKKWLDDLVLSQANALIGFPYLDISSDLIISWHSLLELQGVTPVKIWSTDGKLVTSNLFDSMPRLNSHPTRLLWLFVKRQYVILSTTPTSITIWNAKYPEEFKELSKSNEDYNGHKTVSSNLLVLSYTESFRVIDFTKAVYLYEVCYKKVPYYFTQQKYFFVNEYFYVHLKYVYKNEDSEIISPLLCIYDFRDNSP